MSLKKGDGITGDGCGHFWGIVSSVERCRQITFYDYFKTDLIFFFFTILAIQKFTIDALANKRASSPWP